MRWLLKAAVQGAISLAPQGHRLNYLLQLHVSKRLPAVGSEFDLHVACAGRHIAALEALRPGVDRSALNCYEFGAGWDLIGPIAMWTLGIDHQTLLACHEVDRFRREWDRACVGGREIADPKALRQVFDAYDRACGNGSLHLAEEARYPIGFLGKCLDRRVNERHLDVRPDVAPSRSSTSLRARSRRSCLKHGDYSPIAELSAR